MRRIIIKGFYAVVFVINIALISCSREEQSDSTALFSQELTFSDNGNKKFLDKFFSNSRLICLETNDSSIIGGRFRKVIKHGSRFYVRSFNEIMMFDHDGMFLGKLSKAGEAPDEYPEIYDFEVATINGTDEIMIASNGGIYRYSAPSMEFMEIIPYNGFVSQLKYVNDSTIIINVPEDITFKILCPDGEVRKEFFKKDIANSMESPVGFRKQGSKVIYKLSDSNEAVVYDAKTDSMSVERIFNTQANVQTAELNREYYQKYGYMDFLDKIEETYTGIIGFQCVNDNVLIVTKNPDGTRFMTLATPNEISTTQYYPELSFNPGIQVENPIVLTTFIGCESDDSFMFLIGAEYLQDKDEEDNPCILEIIP